MKVYLNFNGIYHGNFLEWFENYTSKTGGFVKDIKEKKSFVLRGNLYCGYFIWDEIGERWNLVVEVEVPTGEPLILFAFLKMMPFSQECTVTVDEPDWNLEALRGVKG